ncbi:uncharacterized protein AKAME5_000532800 [Lates japonicus]|uniref:Uncharacterized protein n=1 Tax=Lates japonicus TaxID=270547 RepID=A0AAD3MEI5_LATJO|nr:uncharacterized protein AKAME5_000532800 [Lates japonicus]
MAGIEEEPNSSSPKAVAKVIREVLQINWDIKVDRSHNTLAARKPGDRERPRVIIPKLHYDEDTMEILRRAQDSHITKGTYKGYRRAECILAGN